MSLPRPSHWTSSRFFEYVSLAVHALFGTLVLVRGLTGDGPDDRWAGPAVAAVIYGQAFLTLPRRGSAGARAGALVFAASRLRLVGGHGSLLAGAAVVSVLVGLPWGPAAGAGMLAVVAFLDRDLVLEVALDPDAVTVRTVRHRRRVPWVEAADGLGMPSSRFLRVGGGPRLDTRVLAADPATLYWTLRHYSTRAQDRDELADGRAVARVRDHDLVPASLAERELVLG